MKKLLILPLLLMLSGCVTYYSPETALEDGVYYAADDPSYLVYSGTYRGAAYYPWASIDFFYLGYYPHRYYWHHYPWYVDHYRSRHYWTSWPYNGHCSYGDCRPGHRKARRDRGRERYAGNTRNQVPSSSRSRKSAARSGSSRSVRSSSGGKMSRAAARESRD